MSLNLRETRGGGEDKIRTDESGDVSSSSSSSEPRSNRRPPSQTFIKSKKHNCRFMNTNVTLSTKGLWVFFLPQECSFADSFNFRIVFMVKSEAVK